MYDKLDNLKSNIDTSEEIAKLKAELNQLRRIVESPNPGNPFYQELLNSLEEGFSLLDPDGKIEFVNEQFLEILGYTADEVIGMRPEEMIWELENQEFFLEKHKKRKEGVADSYEIQVKHKSGHPIWMMVKAKPLFNSDGSYRGIMTLHYDISRELETRERLRKSKEQMEARVLNRTAELRETNHLLQNQMKERKLAQLELHKSKKRIEEIFNNSPDGIFVEDLDGKILQANDAAVKLHQLNSKEDLIGMSVFDLTPKSFENEVADKFEQILKEKVQSFESYSLLSNGEIIPVEITARLIEYDQKPAVLLNVRDITERRASEELLKRSFEELEERVANRTKELSELNEQLKSEIEERKRFEKELKKQESYLRTIIDTDPSMIFVKDSRGRFVMANQAVADTYGTTVNDLIGKDNSHFNHISDELNSFHDQDRKVFESGNPVVIANDKVTNPKTGETRIFQTIKVPISFDDDGSNTHILGVSTDITDLTKARLDVDKHKDLYREIAHSIPNSAIYLFNENLEYVLADGPEVEFFGYPKEFLEGRHIHEAITAETLQWIEPMYRRVFAGESSEKGFTHKDRHYNLSVIPIYNNQGEVQFGMALATNVTDLKKSESALEKRAAQLARSNEDLEKFAYVASHDLQEPLRSVASYVQLLKNRYSGELDEEAEEFISFAIDGVKRMQALIQDLLSYSRLTFKDQPYQETDLNALLEGVQKNLEETIVKREARIEVQGLPTLAVDPSQIIQLFQNLLENAMKFCQETKPEIKVYAEELDNHWKISVQDNGIGIPKQFVNKIFVIFQRLHSRSDYKGTGIGLAICKKITERHGGEIWVESEEGNGTTFHLTISKRLENSY